MKCPLAIFAPHIGNRTETFVRRHMCDILPGRTAVIVKSVRQDPDAAKWDVPPPVMAIADHSRENLKRQIVRAIGWQLGWEPPDPGMRAVKRFLKEHEVNVIMGEYLDETLPYIDLANELGIKMFAHAHGYDVSAYLRSEKWRKEYLKLNEADGVITMSEYSKQRLVEIGIYSEKIHIIPYGVDVPEERPMREDTCKRTRCLAVGRMTPKKAPIYLLESFRRASMIVPELRLDVVGGGLGTMTSAAAEFVHAMHLSGSVTLHGPKPGGTVMRLMQDADVFLQHSVTATETGDQEGLPVAILEAMAHALPVISTRHAGIPEAVVHGTTGLLVAEGDVDGMAAHIVELSRDCAKRRRMGLAARERVAEKFSSSLEKRRLLHVLGLPSDTSFSGAPNGGCGSETSERTDGLNVPRGLRR